MDDIKDLHFPFAGMDTVQAFSRQPNKEAYQGVFGRTTPFANNVRAFDSIGRLRGGSRGGLKKLVQGQVAGEYFIVQLLAVVVTTSESAL